MEVPHLFNPSRAYDDFPSTVIACFPAYPTMTRKLLITRDGVLTEAHYHEAFPTTVQGRFFEIGFHPNGDRSMPPQIIYPSVEETMVYSFYDGLYGEDDVLLNVLHHNRSKRDLTVDNLVPVFNLEQLASYRWWSMHQ